ncbi:MAG: bi-domain-containing oxidoreductase [Planctomycetaceae bacterium]|nr:bi-domain-containing oxidoreductase [Planctomycetaceae bacterium]
MQQLLQNIRDGKLSLARIPDPLVQPGELLIANSASVVSAGTEKMVMDLAKKSLLGKARERPDHVRRVLEKVRNEGLLTTIRQVREKLDSPMSMGYSSAGIVLACGAGVQDYKPGDRVASNGPHAELVSIPRNLCARVPDRVPFDQAAFAVLGAIAMQGARLAETGLGETVFVIGLGLIGQLAVSILNAAGCRVIGTDLDAAKCELAMRMGAELARPNLSAQHVADATRGLGADAVVITASTQSNGPIELAASAVRQKGRVVLVGVVGLELDRRAFYFKETEFVVSCSYGPGRYDADYEERGRDYPAAYVRWTEQRNIQSVLDLMARGKLDVTPLISHRYAIERATDAYAMIESGSEPYLGIVIEYPSIAARVQQPAIRLGNNAQPKATDKPAIGVLGAGNFARMVLLPALAQTGKLRLATLCTPGGVSAATVGAKLEFEQATTDEDALFADPDLSAIVSITRHDQHARHVLKAIRAGKHVFVEKPLCLTIEELEEIEAALVAAGSAAPVVMVGFNRRFSPAAKQVKRVFADVGTPLTISVRFNAGAIPADHWTQDDAEGGGRIVGEACHGIDLATYLAGSPPVRVYAESVGGTGEAGGAPGITDDQCFITLRHANGSISNIAYLAGGDKAFPKERVEVFGGGRVAVIDDFRSVTTCVRGKTKRTKLAGQDKGHQAEVDAFARSISEGGEPPITWGDLRGVSLAAILAVRSLREGSPLEL